MQRMALELLLQPRHGRNWLQVQCFSLNNPENLGKHKELTPPSRIRNGSTFHSSFTAFASALKYGSSSSPNHQSAVCTTSAYIVPWASPASDQISIPTWSWLGLLNPLNVDFKKSIKDWMIVSKSWSGTMRKDIWALTVLGMTVESEWSYWIREWSWIWTYRKFVSLFGPLISILCIVRDGSRHLERRSEAGFCVTSESNL